MKTKVSLLLTGSELMNGDVIDTNSVVFAKHLNGIGLNIDKKVTVGDAQDLLATEIALLSQESDVLIINGGLGPTVDDLTAQVLATACSVDLVLHKQAHQHLEIWAKKRQTILNTPNLKQAYLPENSTVIANKIGSAVGFSVEFNQCIIICTPGVPSELTCMLKEEIVPLLKNSFSSPNYTEIQRFHLFGIGESSLQVLINQTFPDWPKVIAIGFRAAMPILELKLITHCEKGKRLLPQLLEKLAPLLTDYILGSGTNENTTIADYLVPLLIKSKQKITVAESCTGGLIASQITAIAGASEIFEAGFVTYSNEMKIKMLDVPESTLTRHGAVSEETVLAMAQGALISADADFAIAVSGIAGPDGGSKEKPVGSVWIAWGSRDNLQARYYCIPAARKHFQQSVSARSLNLVRKMLIESNEILHNDKLK
ncbi:CinA family nicotinamide mononucleotide deamidase-related protein [Cognaticolwellia mytili]|uniref:CinA family nicotinamide mononucleotide deamidase-related protein n=1 Tax=Cognaticolwellia mytili TaxID=1888913 RepID=UPI000A16CBCA|nr:CinA family nicotinamide mononucleotide deamidase-related protein [Cognaticolwellia mytili]